MSLEYYAITHPDDSTKVENVFIVERASDAVNFVVFDRRRRRWVSHPYLAKYLFGEEQDDCQQITRDAAAELLGAWSVALPTEDELSDAREVQ